MSIFAKVPFEDVVLRSHEMLPTEYRVLTYLYGRKNRKTGQCNPRKAMIARDLHIDRSNVSRALDGLVKRGWIALDDDQNWQFFIPVTMGKPTLPFAPRRGGRNVVKITTKPNVENVVNLTTNEPEIKEDDVVNLTTEVCDIRTPVLSIYPKAERARNISSSLTEKEQSIEQNKNTLSKTTSEKVHRIFGHWQAVFNHPTSKLTNERKRYVNTRLKEGYTEAEIILAIDGCANSPHHMGMNDQGKVYDDLTLICRSGSKLEQFIGYNNRNKENHNGSHNKPSSEREKSSERSENGYRMVAELRRIAAEENQRRLSSGDDGGNPQNPLAR